MEPTAPTPLRPAYPPSRTPGYTRVLVNDEVLDEQWQLSSDVTTG